MQALLFLLFAAALFAADYLMERRRRQARLAYARQANAEFRYCPLCAANLYAKDVAGKTRLTCLECGFVHWDNPKPVTITLVPMDDGLVLVKRKLDPGKGLWALPGGFIEGFEKPVEGASREVLEETSLTVEIDRVVGAFGARPGVNQVIFVFLARPAQGTPVAGDDALEARVFKHDEVPWDEIAFPLHKEAIKRFFQDKLPGGGA